MRRLWQERRGVPAPPTLSGRLMRLALAWEIQADKEGGESPEVRRRWQAVMTRRAGGAGAGDAVSGLSAPPTAAGTRLLKSWGGETHEVVVTAEGVVWNGKPYSSLSAVARAMTGTPRNGPKFFGLREDRQ
ncbi:MAG: DUF2924 domain-containing protein [Rhodobacteraceae bacterium]|nr:DUF2924 domain-containing protein [Paracoccaceae bacterium]